MTTITTSILQCTGGTSQCYKARQIKETKDITKSKKYFFREKSKVVICRWHDYVCMYVKSLKECTIY